ncbi:efflux RND transporter periplasmic adaptor subunit [bacterium]|nr:efflux RND transporter periplasmic adaptor subunit [bacterium]
MKNKIRLISLIGITLIIVLAFSINKLTSEQKTNTGKSTRSADPTIAVRAHVIKPEKLSNRVLTTGTILANEEVDLRSEISGRIMQIAFTEGSRINKGQLLIKINDAELQAQLERAESRRKLAETNENRQRQLLEKNAISQGEYDVALNELNIVKADIDLIKAQIDKTELRAPFDGVIGLKYVSEGSFITNSSQIARLQNLTSVKIDFSVPEKYSGSVRIGNAIVFRVQGSDKEYRGKIYAIEPKIDPVTRTVQLRAISTFADDRVLPGAFANVELVLAEINDALLIPTQALVPELKGQKVYLYKNGEAVSQSVEIGMRTENQIQIVSGIRPNDTLITTGILQLRGGAPVKILEFE